ncbi:kinase-like protein [Rhizophagus irregularis]|uniref:Kinase-like protein n=1 Tax=Rhizophagus irregularis TaxID=588596 RepID=A0A2I1FWT1_9GLOM|nr:kinase-like protein [Rhizophagus irregularis]
MKYYENGDLYQYLVDRSNGILCWRDMINMLWSITGGLERIHTEGKVHKNLHGGNLLIEDEEISTNARISDVGLYGPCYYENNNSGQIYGVLPYIAPEVLRGEDYTPASDVYSFGIIMYTLAAGKRPWYDRAHDHYLAKSICDGERLKIPDDTPKFYAELMKQCCDSEPGNRPTVSYLYKKLNWINLIRDNPNPFDDDYYISEKIRFKLASQLLKIYTHPEIHPEAHYTSRPFGFGSVHPALWMEGPRWSWDDEHFELGLAMTVALKRLDNLQNISSSYINQNGILSWRDMIDTWGIAGGLERIHAEGKVHKNLRGGNLLIEDEKFLLTLALIGDLGLYRPSYNIETEPEKRPTASYLNEKLGEWITLICDDPSPSQISDESSVTEEKRWK